MGETEAYTKIKLRTIEDVLVAGGPAFDLVHLLAELLENATQFSPPETPVELHAIRLEDSSYQITIIDRGVGMDDDKVEIANELVSNPPEINLAIGRSIGFIVVGRLADRLGATVEIAHTPGSGVTATVIVPANVVIDAPSPSTPASSLPAPGPSQAGTSPTPSDQPHPATARTAPKPKTKPTPKDEPTPASAAGGDPVRPRVTEDSSNALAKLLGISDNIDELGDSDQWQAPTVDGGKANPLKSRSTPDPVPPSLGGDPGASADDQVEPSPESSAEATGGDSPAQPKRTSRAKRSKSGRSKRRSRPVRSLDEALPSGVAFDSGIEGLLIKASESSEADSTSSIEDLRPVEEETAPDEAPTADATTDEASSSDTPTGDTTGDETTSDEATSDEASSSETAASEDAWVPPTVSGSAETNLTRREKGASKLPSSNGPRVKASSRKPEEIRSMITRYRDGLKGSADDTTDDASESNRETQAEDASPAESPETPSPEPGKEG